MQGSKNVNENIKSYCEHEYMQGWVEEGKHKSTWLRKPTGDKPIFLFSFILSYLKYLPIYIYFFNIDPFS